MPSSAVVGVLALSVACSTTPVRPLGRGGTAIGAGLGGPIVEAFGAPIPTPILSVEAGQGVRDDLDVRGALDVTAAAYGVAHVAPGIAWHPVVRDGGSVPTVTLAGSAHVLTDFSALRVAPAVTAAAAWRVRASHLLYLGLDAAPVFGHPTRLLWGPLGGAEFLAGTWGLGVEARWLVPQHDTEPLAPTWIAPAHHGYLSIVLGAHRYFGGVR